SPIVATPGTEPVSGLAGPASAPVPLPVAPPDCADVPLPPLDPPAPPLPAGPRAGPRAGPPPGGADPGGEAPVPDGALPVPVDLAEASRDPGCAVPTDCAPPGVAPSPGKPAVPPPAGPAGDDPPGGDAEAIAPSGLLLSAPGEEFGAAVFADGEPVAGA